MLVIAYSRNSFWENEMKKINNYFNYELCQKIFNLKQNESDTIFDTINQFMEIFHKIYFEKTKRHIYLISKEIKFTKEVDPSYYLSLKYAISSIQDLIIDLPLIYDGDSIMINGNNYNPILQMIDKPLIIKKKNNSAVLMTNLGNIYSTAITNENLIRIFLSSNKKFMPPAIVWFLGFIGVEEFQNMTGAKLVIKEADYSMPLCEYFDQQKLFFDTTNLTEEYDTEKFRWLVNQNPFLCNEIKKFDMAPKLAGFVAKDLLSNKGWEAFMAAYDGTRTLTKIFIHQRLMTMIDIFSAKFMKHTDVVKEMLRAFSKDVEPLDLKDLTMKRFRCYEMFLLTFMKHIYNIGMNCMYNKITSVSKEKRLRIYDNALNNNLTSYDGVRNNSIMRLSEKTRLSQTGDNGYTSDMFVGAARDLHESQYGTICPINTPDREKCGVTLYLAPSNISKFEDMYYWPSPNDNDDLRLPLKNAKEFEEFMKQEEARLAQEREDKKKSEEDNMEKIIAKLAEEELEGATNESNDQI